jgi:gluconate 5-dehydrogenase
MRVQGKVALVTGGSRGIGHAIALGLAREGADVAVMSRTETELLTAAAEIASLGRRTLPVVADVRDEAAVFKAVDTVVEALGSVDILVNAAGIPMVAPSLDLAIDEWRRCIDTNLTGTFLACQAAARHMRRLGRGGKIVNISSIHCESTYPQRAAYAASKGGINMLTKALGIEWAPYGINVNAIAPGQTRTPLQDSLVARGLIDLGPVIGRTPAGRIAEVEDIVGPAIFLASPEANFLVGQTLVIDGGYLANAWPTAWQDEPQSVPTITSSAALASSPSGYANGHLNGHLNGHAKVLAASARP